MTTHAYPHLRRVTYQDAVFVPVCPTCGRFVTADAAMAVHDDLGRECSENATCSKCGRVAMAFEGFWGEGER